MFLSIAIPTFRSEATLFRLLDSIIPQIHRGIRSEVEILISDNDPESQLEEKLNSKYIDAQFKLNYRRNFANIGYDRNLHELLGMANGTYIKFISDDDILEPFFLSNHLLSLHQHSPDIAIVDFRTFQKGDIAPNSQLINMSPQMFAPPWNIEKFAALNWKFGQVSSLTFRVSLIKDCTQEIESNYIHIYWVLSALEKSKLLYEKSPQILVQLGSPNFSGSNFKIIETSIVGINAVRFAPMLDSNFKTSILRHSQKYSLQSLRLLSEISFFDRIKVLSLAKKDIAARPIHSMRYIPYLLATRRIKRLIKKFIIR